MDGTVVDPGRSVAARLARSGAVRVLAITFVIAFCAFIAVRTAGGPEELAARLSGELGGVVGVGVALGLVALQSLIALSPFPSQVAAIPLAFLFGFWGGAALVWLGWFITAYAEYELVRRAASDLDFSERRPRMWRIVRDLPAHSPVFLIALRWLPGGSHVVNGAAGAYGVSLRRHLSCAAISIVPRALFVSGVVHGLRWL